MIIHITDLRLEVPVVAIFTKFDAPSARLYTEYEDEFEDYDESKLNEMVDAKMKDLRNHLELLIRSAAHPPSAHLFLQSRFPGIARSRQ